MSNAQSLTAIDIWIGRELKRSYDEVLVEPVPDELARLLGNFAARN